MATYVPTDGVVTVYVGNAYQGNTKTTIKSISDGDTTDDKFSTSDTLTLTVDNNGTESESGGWKYVGTTTAINGGPYIVIEQTIGAIKFTYVVGTGSTGKTGMVPSGGKEAPANVSDLNINTATFTVCYFPGTLIATPFGERKIEDLVSGDQILIGDADAVSEKWIGRIMRWVRRKHRFTRTVSVKWIGCQTISTRFGPAERLMPVRFATGSLGGGGQPLLPHSDLTVTADHAILVDDVLCEAAALVNGTTITRVPLSEFNESYTVYHVETEAHEIVLANGAPAETFVDNVSRRAFDNYAEFEKFHGDQPEMKELPYPRASNARHLPARIKARLSIGPRKDSAA